MAQYQIDRRLPQYIEREKTQVLRLPVEYEGDIVPPVSGTYTLYDSSKNIIKTGAISVVNKVAQFTLSSSDIPATTLLTTQAQEEWILTFSEPESTIETINRRVYICLRTLYPTVTHSSLEDEFAIINDLLTKEQISNKIRASWEYLQRLLNREEKRPYLIMDSSQLTDLHMFLCLEKIFSDLENGTSDTGNYAKQMEKYAKKADLAKESLTLLYDLAELNRISSAINAVPVESTVTFNARPQIPWIAGQRW